MTITYIAVQSKPGPDKPWRSDGYLVADGNAYTARSGGWGRGNIPSGTYKVDGGWAISNDNIKSMSPQGTTAKTKKRYKKFLISGVGPTSAGGSGRLRDSRYSEARTEVMFHFDGGVKGSLGCITYDDPAAQQSIEAALAEGKDVQVIHVATDAEARAKATELAGGKAPPVNTIRGYGGYNMKTRDGRALRERQKNDHITYVRNGAKMAEGEPTVVLGGEQRMAAHVQARHTGGGRVAQGSPTVFVGRRLRPFGRVSDPTTDGSELMTGESSVLVG